MSTTEEKKATAADDPVDSEAAKAMDASPEDFPVSSFPAGPGASAHRPEPVGQEGFLFDRALDDELERGEKLAKLYLKEREERPADHPLVLARARNEEVEKTRELSEDKDEEGGSRSRAKK